MINRSPRVQSCAGMHPPRVVPDRFRVPYFGCAREGKISVRETPSPFRFAHRGVTGLYAATMHCRDTILLFCNPFGDILPSINVAMFSSRRQYLRAQAFSKRASGMAAIGAGPRRALPDSDCHCCGHHISSSCEPKCAHVLRYSAVCACMIPARGHVDGVGLARLLI